MRVLMLMRGQGGVPGTSGVPGGQIGMAKIAEALTSLGASVHVLISGPLPEYLPELPADQTTTMPWPVTLDKIISKSPGIVKRQGVGIRRRVWRRVMSRVVTQVSPQVVHVQGIEDGGAFIALHNIPTVITHWGRSGRWRGSAPAIPGFMSTPATGSVRPILVALGCAQATEMRDVGLPPDEIIPPGLDTETFSPGDRATARKLLGLDLGIGIVLYVGRLSRDKNVGALLKSFALLMNSKPDAKLMIIGNGPLYSEIFEQATKLGIERHISRKSYVPQQELVHYYRAANVTAVPSDRLETFCMVALEAIASGCPLVVTDQVPEIVSRFPGVAVVGSGEYARFAEVFASAIDSRLPPACTAGLSSFTWRSIALQYLNMYRTLIDDHQQ